MWFDPSLTGLFRVIYYFDTPTLERRYQSFGRVSLPPGYGQVFNRLSE